MSLFQDVVPKDVKVSFEFDESPTVVQAVRSVASEGLIGALVIDRADAPAESDVPLVVTDTLMTDRDAGRRLAEVVLEAVA